MNSVWIKDINKPEFPSLNKDIKTDVLIIGGGMAGILCLRELTDRGVDCVLLEAKNYIKNNLVCKYILGFLFLILAKLLPFPKFLQK